MKYRFYLTKLFFIISLFTAPLYGCSNSIEEYDDKPKHHIPLHIKPLTQPDDPILTEKRKKCISRKEIFSLFPNNSLLEKVPKGTRPGVCYNVAMKECLGLSKAQFQQIEQSIVGLSDWVSIIGMPHKFFDQQQNPHPGYLATYTPKNSNDIKHFGITRPNSRIKSKIGTSKYTIEHDYWDLPDWGENICFWRLKAIYHNEIGKDKLFSKIIKIIQNSKHIKLILEDAQKTLFAIAANKPCDTFFSRINWENPYHLIKGITGLNIDLPDHNGETALMMASRNGDRELVDFLIECGANPHLKNKDGKNALDLQQYNYQNIINNLNPKSAITYYSLVTLALTIYYLYHNII